MTQKLLLILLTFSFVCQGQTLVTDNFQEINYKDVTEINGLVYYKADTTLVSGKIIRYNKKNKAKSYALVSKGKPDRFGWVQIKDKYQEPEKKLRIKLTNNVVNEKGHVIGSVDKPINQYYDQMSDRNDITSDLQSNANVARLNKAKETNYESEVSKNNSLNNEVDRNGVWENHYSNGNLESKGVYVDGKKDGLWEEFYENGKLKRKVNYKKGIKDGVWEQYHTNTQLWGNGLYKGDRMIGEWKYYDEKGKVLLTENYDD